MKNKLSVVFGEESVSGSTEIPFPKSFNQVLTVTITPEKASVKSVSRDGFKLISDGKTEVTWIAVGE